MNNNYDNQIGIATYTKKVHYWNPITGRYTIFGGSISVRFWNRVDYFGLFDGNIADIGRTFLLINSINYNNFVCKLDKHSRHQVPLNSYEQLMELVGISNRSTFKKFFNKLVERNIIAEIYENDVVDSNKKYRRFVINPIYGMKAKGITPSVFKLFHKSLSPLISSNAYRDLSYLVNEEEGRNTLPETNVNQLTPIDNADNLTPLEIFHKYILRGNKALTYAKINGMISSDIQMDIDMYFLVNGTEKYLTKKTLQQRHRGV